MKGKNRPPTEAELLKMEVAAWLGLDEKIKNEGWGALTTSESGRIGGMVAARKRNKPPQD